MNFLVVLSEKLVGDSSATRLAALLKILRMVKHFQSSQNRKFATSLQHLKKEVKNEFDFLYALLLLLLLLLLILYFSLTNLYSLNRSNNLDRLI